MPLDNISELKRRVPGGKYALARAIAERARQLQGGSTPLVEVRTPNPLSVAIDEIVNGKVTFDIETADQVDVREATAKADKADKAGKSKAEAKSAVEQAADAISISDASSDGTA